MSPTRQWSWKDVTQIYIDGVLWDGPVEVYKTRQEKEKEERLLLCETDWSVSWDPIMKVSKEFAKIQKKHLFKEKLVVEREVKDLVIPEKCNYAEPQLVLIGGKSVETMTVGKMYMYDAPVADQIRDEGVRLGKQVCRCLREFPICSQVGESVSLALIKGAYNESFKMYFVCKHCAENWKARNLEDIYYL